MRLFQYETLHFKYDYNVFNYFCLLFLVLCVSFKTKCGKGRKMTYFAWNRNQE